MTDHRPDTTRAPIREPFDEAIDRAVRDLMAREAPSDLRARVLARLEAPVSAGAWRASGRIAWVGAAVAVVLVAMFLARPPRPAPLVEPEAVVAETPPAAEPPTRVPAPAEAASPEGPTPEPRARAVGAGTTPSAPAVRVVAAAAVVEPEPYTFGASRLVEPLEEPPVVAIEPLAEPYLAVVPIAVDRLNLEPVVIGPLSPDR